MTSPIRWLVYCLLASAAIAVVVFPSPKPDEYLAPDRFSRALYDGKDEWGFHSELLRREQARQIARATVAQSRVKSAENFEVISGRDVPASVVGLVQKAAARAYGTLSPRDSTVRIVISVALDTVSAYDGVPLQRAGRTTSSDVFVPGAVDANACVIVIRLMNPRVFPSNRAGFVDGPCYWYGRYGIPGRGVATLLDSTRSRAILNHGRVGYSTLAYEASQYFTLPLNACRSGDKDACAGILLSPPQRVPALALVRTPGWIGDGRGEGFGYYSFPSTGVLQVIERDLGAEAFERLWKSDLAFPEAFASIRGVPLGEWIYGVISGPVSERVSARLSGPLPSPKLWLVLGFAITASLALGAYGTSRRTGLV